MGVRTFHSPAGLEILVGLDAPGNVQVTFRLGRPRDLWFHVKGTPGSHVVLRQPADGSEPDRASVELAAGLAVWHSRMRAGGLVSVSCCRLADVARIPGAPPGTVRIRRERRLAVRPCPPPPEE